MKLKKWKCNKCKCLSICWREDEGHLCKKHYDKYIQKTKGKYVKN